MQVFCIGEAMIEVSLSPEGTSALIGVAGDVLNTAIYLRRAAPSQTEVAFVSAVGSDIMSERIRSFAQRHGLDCSRLRTDPNRTAGLYAISVDAVGERSFSYWRSASAARSMFGQDDRPDFSGLDGADMIYVSAITLAILSPAVRQRLLDTLAVCRANGTTIAFDSNYRPKLWEDVQTARATVTDAWSLTDIGFPSLDDEMALFGESEADTVARLKRYGIKICVLKRGDRGPQILSDVAIIPEVDFARADQVVDTTGAGDSFNGTFLAHYLSSPEDVAGGLKAAHDVARRVVGIRGAVLDDPFTGMPIAE